MREHILKNSVDLFRKYGYSKTTLTDIAKSIGKVKSAIYYYFGGKEEIFASIVKSEAKEFYEKLEKKINSVNVAEDQIQLYIENRILLMQKVADRYSFLKAELFELLPLLEENRKTFLLKEVELLAKILSDYYLESGHKLTEKEIEFKANLLVSTLKGMEIQMYVTDEILINKNQMSEFKSFLLFGLLNTKNK
jgi:AcrR family transcriptional regulator